MSELTDFGLVVLLVSGSFLLALAAHKVTERFPVPAPALFLAGAAVASEIWPGLSRLSTVDVERIAVVALIVILFDGGMHVGWARFRGAAVPITVLGVFGTFGTAGAIALAAHALFGFAWITAGILGAALAPTDPAVMFSVLGKQEIGGRTGTILEGESGANDPVGIALMIGMLDYATHPDASFWTVVREFAVEMSVGLAIGIAGALILAARAPPRLAAERGLVPAADTRRRRSRLRRRRRRARLRVPRRLRRRPPARERRRAAQAGDRALSHVAREPRGDRRVRRSRADDRPRLPRRARRLARRDPARARPQPRRASGRRRPAADPDAAADRRADLRRSGAASRALCRSCSPPSR